MQEWPDPVAEPPMPDQPPRNAASHSRPASAWRARRLAERAWFWLVLAFAAGLILFLALWWRDRGNDFYRAQPVPETAEGQQFEPLPAPLPAGDAAGNASGMDEPAADEAPADRPEPHIVPSPAVPRAGPSPAGPGTSAPTSAFIAPVPIQSPAPSYPPEAYRNGESGTVLLRVHVDPQGVPYAVDLVQSSRSRTLDRAASEAVKRWRFRPAQQDGHAVAGEVQVPFAFNANR